jgi:hypothetical protein
MVRALFQDENKRRAGVGYKIPCQPSAVIATGFRAVNSYVSTPMTDRAGKKGMILGLYLLGSVFPEVKI